MNEKLFIFDYIFNNDELEKEFNDFFYKYNLLSLFTDEYRAGTIKVTYVDAKSVVNEGGSYNKTLRKFTEYISLASDNLSFQESMFKFIHEAKTFQTLINRIKRVMSYIDNIQEDRKFNTWNIVWYTREVY